MGGSWRWQSARVPASMKAKQPDNSLLWYRTGLFWLQTQ